MLWRPSACSAIERSTSAHFSTAERTSAIGRGTVLNSSWGMQNSGLSSRKPCEQRQTFFALARRSSDDPCSTTAAPCGPIENVGAKWGLTMCGAPVVQSFVFLSIVVPSSWSGGSNLCDLAQLLIGRGHDLTPRSALPAGRARLGSVQLAPGSSQQNTVTHNTDSRRRICDARER
jgi:hypothetical protein